MKVIFRVLFVELSNMLRTSTRGFAAQGVFCHSAIQSAQQLGTNGSRSNNQDHMPD